MKKILICLIALVAFTVLFGCTVSVNPADLAPTKKYTNALDINTGTVGLDTNSSTQTKVSLTATEIAKHNVGGNCWMIINGNVYDLSDYVSHPGGSGYLSYCGTNATQGYDTKGGRGVMHSSYSDALLANYLIGTLGQDVTITNSAISNTTTGTATSVPGNNREDDDYWDD